MSVLLNYLDIDSIEIDVDITSFYRAMNNNQKQEILELLVEDGFAIEPKSI